MESIKPNEGKKEKGAERETDGETERETENPNKWKRDRNMSTI